jgi:hypothetical protein
MASNASSLATALSSAFIADPDSRPSSRSREREPDCQSHQKKANRQQRTIAEPFNVSVADHNSSTGLWPWIVSGRCNGRLIVV